MPLLNLYIEFDKVAQKKMLTYVFTNLLCMQQGEVKQELKLYQENNKFQGKLNQVGPILTRFLQEFQESTFTLPGPVSRLMSWM